MPIEIIGTGRHGTRRRPIIVCDHCGLLIAAASDGDVHYFWPTVEQRTSYINFAHKACSDALRAKKRDYPLDGTMWLRCELTKFLEDLLHNADCTPEP